MIEFGYISLCVLFLVYGLAKGADRFDVGPRWFRQLIIDERHVEES
jgi:hypothetical protein